MKSTSNYSLIVISILAVIFVTWVSYMLYHMIQAKGQHIHDIALTTTVSAEHAQQIKGLEASLATLTPQIEKLDSYIIAPDGEVDFINKLEDIGRSHGVDVQTNSVGVQASKELPTTMQYLALKVTAQGGWGGVYRFASLISNLPYKILVDQADISDISDKSTTTRQVWQGVFTIRVVQKVQ